ncbi:MAG: hypothetical protein R6X12_09140 [bacterium]
MPKCPHCGEPYRYGQEKCYACGEPVKGRGGRGAGAVNPLVFVVAGGLVLIAVVGIVLVWNNRREAARERAAEIEQQRVRDSVRQADLDRRFALRQSRKEEGVGAVIADLEYRLSRLTSKADRGQVSAEKAELVSEAERRINELKVRLASMAGKLEVEQEAAADTVRAQAVEIRDLLSKISRTR